MRLIAFDLSLTASGVVSPEGEAETLKPPPKLTPAERLTWWSQTFGVLRELHQPDRVVVEQGFFRHVKTSQLLNQLYGVFIVAFGGIPITWVPPATLKKAYVGSGRATKFDMRDAAHAWCHDVTGLDDNAVDALALWALCRDGVFEL